MTLAAVAGLTVGQGCDAGTFRKDPATQPTEPLRVVGSNVGTNRPLPVDGAVQIAFNRYLLPSTGIRQSIRIVTATGASTGSPRVQYDPVARTLNVLSPNEAGDGGAPWLVEGQTYRVQLSVAQEGEDGLRALDGATLAEPVEITFLVTGRGAVPDPKPSFCNDIAPIFLGKCDGDTCHGAGGKQAAGLMLTTAAGFRGTARGNDDGRVAQGANTGATDTPTPTPRVFGVNMPLVKPGDPGNSWLLYKVLLAPPPVAPPSAPFAPFVCAKGGPVAPEYLPATGGVTPAPSEREQQVLRDAILGREMPFPTGFRDYRSLPLTFAEREMLRLWIRDGAQVPDDCGSCGVPKPPVDAGTDAAPSEDAATPPDAGADAAPGDAGGD